MSSFQLPVESHWMKHPLKVKMGKPGLKEKHPRVWWRLHLWKALYPLHRYREIFLNRMMLASMVDWASNRLSQNFMDLSKNQEIPPLFLQLQRSENQDMTSKKLKTKKSKLKESRSKIKKSIANCFIISKSRQKIAKNSRKWWHLLWSFQKLLTQWFRRIT